MFPVSSFTLKSYLINVGGDDELRFCHKRVSVCVRLFELFRIVFRRSVCLYRSISIKTAPVPQQKPACALPLLLSRQADMRRAVGRACHT